MLSSHDFQPKIILLSALVFQRLFDSLEKAGFSQDKCDFNSLDGQAIVAAVSAADICVTAALLFQLED